ncbi:MAG TPA: arginine--tRNA ligase, partial [Dehalococcoidia bacterium]|nr:arginine--tRNA ligase [Dehalococcoidia bacterium]
MSIRDEIAELVDAAARAAQKSGDIPAVVLPEPAVERPARPEHGDYASSLPLRLARAARQNPIALAETIARQIASHAAVGEVTVAPPGFVNIRLADDWLTKQINQIIAAGPSFADSKVGAGRKVQIEFVSANPTGPLHVGNGRWASIGDSLARVLTASGYETEKEYLVNDQFTQVDTFAATLLARYKQLFGVEAEIPEEGYPGEYVIDLAKRARDQFGDRFLNEALAPQELRRFAVDSMIAMIRDDLAAMNVLYDNWFYESSLYGPDGCYPEAMQRLRDQGAVVEKEGAVWLASSALGEERDNVLIRSTGIPTYFASDIAYHYDKFFRRGFDQVIDIWGADHQGHVSRVKTAVQALGVEEGRLEILIGQLVALRRGGQAVRLSKRAGEIITLREVVDEVGADACRFFFLQRSADSQMEFDIDLAKRQSNENPVYYVQYAHARIASILRKAAESGLAPAASIAGLLAEAPDALLARVVSRFPEIVEDAAAAQETQG